MVISKLLRRPLIGTRFLLSDRLSSTRLYYFHYGKLRYLGNESVHPLTQGNETEQKAGLRSHYNLRDVSVAFKNKSSMELLRAVIVLKISSFDLFVNHSEKILQLSKRLLGKYIFSHILKRTFYGQFCAGEDIQETYETISLLKDAGIRSMVCLPFETISDNDSEASRRLKDEHMKAMSNCIETTATFEKNGFAQLKLTALCSFRVLLAMNEDIKNYDRCRSESSEWDIARIARALELGKLEEINISSLNKDLNEEFRDVLQKLCILGQKCHQKGVRLMIDAEQTYIQNSLNYLILVMQAVFNKVEPVIYNTYQCYRKDTLSRIKSDYETGKSMNFKISGKLVRGAYLEEERKRASDLGYDDPINDTFKDTTAMYHSVIDFLMPLIVSNETRVMLATHNEETVQYAMERMKYFGISPDDQRICFAQLLGMCDHVSYSLGKYGYQVFKSTPYGDVDKTLLYLCRRARENRSVIARALFEMELLMTELKTRFRRVAWL